MDGVEQRHRLLGLIGLQRANQMQQQPRMRRNQRRPFRFGFLYAIFAKGALSGRNDRRNRVGVEGF